MDRSNVDQQLAGIERQCDLLGAALVEGDTSELVLISTLLRQMALDLSGSSLLTGQAGRGKHTLARRLRALQARLGAQREGMLRCCALVDHGLRSIVPAAQKATYTHSKATYGAPVPQSGTFNYFRA